MREEERKEERKEGRKKKRADRNKSPSTIARTGPFCYSRAWKPLTPILGIAHVWTSASDPCSCHLSCPCLCPSHPCSCTCPSLLDEKPDTARVWSTSIGTGPADEVWCEEDPEVPSYLRNVSAYSRDQPRIAVYDAHTLEGACFRMCWWLSGKCSSTIAAKIQPEMSTPLAVR